MSRGGDKQKKNKGNFSFFFFLRGKREWNGMEQNVREWGGMGYACWEERMLISKDIIRRRSLGDGMPTCASKCSKISARSLALLSQKIGWLLNLLRDNKCCGVLLLVFLFVRFVYCCSLLCMAYRFPDVSCYWVWLITLMFCLAVCIYVVCQVFSVKACV